jgi:maleate cis-trans isomerase
MFEDDTPRHKIGYLSPLGIIENAAYEFYRLAPPGLMLVMIPIGLEKFTSEDVERVYAPLDGFLDQMMDRGIDIIMQNGVPLPLLIGLDKHDRLLDHMAKYTGKPATSTVLCVAQTCRQMGVKNVVAVNKWTDAMNVTLGHFLAREGVILCGTANKSLEPAEFVKIRSDDHMHLAYELGRRAFLENPSCDGIYIGGGTWIAEPVCKKLEEEFGRPAICNQTALIRNVLHILNDWTPRPGHSRVLSEP